MRKGLYIGIDHYKSKGIKDLKGCVNDAQEMARALSWSFNSRDSKTTLDNFKPTLLTYEKGDKNLSKGKIKKELIKFFTDRQCSFGVLYFSGHGFHDKFGGYLVTPDATDYDEGIQMNDVLVLVNNSPIKEIIILIDCCFSGYMGELLIVDKKFAALRKGVSIITASSDNEVSIEKDGHGLFTRALLSALSGAAADQFGEIYISGLYNHLSKMFWNSAQKPNLKTNHSSPSAIKKVSASLTLKKLDKLLGYFPTTDYKFPLNKSHLSQIAPYDNKFESIFNDLLRFRETGLVTPIGEKYMFYAAMNSKSCGLTDLGKMYHQILNINRENK